MSDSIVLIPTFKERENIENIIRAVFALEQPFHILIIDDNSPDGTAEIVKNLISTEFEGRLFIEERKGKLGLGTAYIHGFRWGLARNYDYIFEMDADFSHPPASLIDLRNTCHTQGADVAVGSRYIKGGKLVNWPADRIFLSRGASLYTRLITWMPVSDATAGFVCYKREVLKTMNFDKIRFIGYAFQIEMKFAAWQLGFKIKEIPITFTDRIEGVSKMSSNIIKEAVLGVLKMRWNAFFNDYR